MVGLGLGFWLDLGRVWVGVGDLVSASLLVGLGWVWAGSLC